MSDPDTILFFKTLIWEYKITDEEVREIIESGECKGITRKNLLGRALKSRRWYEIKRILPPELLREALSDDVLNTLYPKSLFRNYNHVRKLLYE